MSTILDALRKLQREREVDAPGGDLRHSLTLPAPPAPRRRRLLPLGLVLIAGAAAGAGAYLWGRGPLPERIGGEAVPVEPQAGFARPANPQPGPTVRPEPEPAPRSAAPAVAERAPSGAETGERGLASLTRVGEEARRRAEPEPAEREAAVATATGLGTGTSGGATGAVEGGRDASDPLAMLGLPEGLSGAALERELYRRMRELGIAKKEHTEEFELVREEWLKVRGGGRVRTSVRTARVPTAAPPEASETQPPPVTSTVAGAEPTPTRVASAGSRPEAPGQAASGTPAPEPVTVVQGRAEPRVEPPPPNGDPARPSAALRVVAEPPPRVPDEATQSDSAGRPERPEPGRAEPPDTSADEPELAAFSPPPVEEEPAPEPEPSGGTSGPLDFPDILVQSVRWHPTPERRVATVQLEEAGPLEIREGDIVGGVLVRAIRPATVEVELEGMRKLLPLQP